MPSWNESGRVRALLFLSSIDHVVSFIPRKSPDVLYASGQEPIVHLEADAQEVVQWADSNGVHWAFSDRNAGTRYASFYKDLNHLNRIDWNAVEANDFRDLVIKEGKQAEFLVYDSFPWPLVRRVGVRNQGTADQAKEPFEVPSISR